MRNQTPLLLTAAALCALTTGAAQAQVTQTVLHVFGIGNDGGGANGSLLSDNTGPAGTTRGLYGTTFEGANDACADGGCGMAFKLTPPKTGKENWKESALWNFSGGADGAQPYAGLLAMAKRINADTTFYGGAATGGASGAGTVFALAGKKLTTLYAFTGGSDGSVPVNVVADKSGVLYVSAFNGGGQSNCGTVIKLTPPAKGQSMWTETTIWTFTNGNDGCYPNGLIVGKSGVLYGTAQFGGFGGGYGTVFELIPPKGQQTAWTEQTIWLFTGSPDGATPEAPLTAGKNGVLYGTASNGGSKPYYPGIVFSLTPPKNGKAPWTEQILWSFTGGNDGAGPYGAVILDKSGALYGTTYDGANNNNGAVYKLTPPANGNEAWTETTLWDFSGADGSGPFGGLTADKSGILYGTTFFGGAGTNCDNPTGCGVAFSLTGTGYVP